MLKLYTDRPRRAEWLALLIIVVLAAVLRLGAPGTVEFKRDEANLSYISLDLAHGLPRLHQFPLLGIDSSVGIPNAPVNVYLMTLPYLLTSDPIPATAFVSFLNVIAVVLVYLLAHRYYGPLAAVVAGLFYAVSPWAVIYSRKIWAQDMLPIFVLLTVGTGLLGLIEGKRWAQWLHLPLLSLTGQIHYGTFVLIPLTLYLIVIAVVCRRLKRAFAFSIAVTILLTAPYIIGMVRLSTLSPDTLNKVLAPTARPSTLAWTGESFQDAGLLIAGTEIHSLAGPLVFQQYLATVPDAYPLFNLLLITVIISTLWLIVRIAVRRDARTPIDGLLLLWLLFTPLVYSITWTQVYPHYMIAMIPAAFVVLGAATSDLWHGLKAIHIRFPIRWLIFVPGAALALVIIALQLWLQIALLDFLNTRVTLGGFGTPLSYFAPIRSSVLSQHPQNVLASLDGQYIGYHDETTVWNFLLYDIPSVRFLDYRTEVYPADEALYLSHHCTPNSQNYYLRTPAESCFTFNTRKPGDFDQLAYTPVTDTNKTIFDNGAQVIAYHWDKAKGCLGLAWTVNGPRPEDFNFGVHFLDMDNQEIFVNGQKLQADGLSWRGRYWRAGDRVVQQFCLQSGLEHINEIAGVSVGMYTFEDTLQGRIFHGANLLDTTGAPVGQTLTIRFN